MIIVGVEEAFVHLHFYAPKALVEPDYPNALK
jgi:hypothetical protein